MKTLRRDISPYVKTSRGDAQPPSIGLTSSVLPKAIASHESDCSHTGVSTRNALTSTEHWYALRTTYGRERKACDYIQSQGCIVYMPTIWQERTIAGKKEMVEVSRIPNLFFAYGTEEAIKAFVYDNHNLPFLRFYYRHTHIGAHIKKTPLIVPDSQIRSLQIICAQESANDVIFLNDEVSKFKMGERVKVKEGDFLGVEGIVARFCGQLRVGIVIEGLLTAVTAYVPKAFLEKI